MAGISNVAAIVQKLKTDIPSHSGLDGIGPPPLPDDAFKNLPQVFSPYVFYNAYVTVQEITATRIQSLTGSTGLGPALIQINCWCPDYEAAWAMRNLIDSLLEGFSGTIVAPSSASLVVQGGNHAGHFELYDGARNVHQLITRWRLFCEF